jgi:hypothetical protein
VHDLGCVPCAARGALVAVEGRSGGTWLMQGRCTALVETPL